MCMNAISLDDISALLSANSLDTYSVKFKNGQIRILTRDCLLNCYLRNELNKDSVSSFERCQLA